MRWVGGFGKPQWMSSFHIQVWTALIDWLIVCFLPAMQSFLPAKKDFDCNILCVFGWLRPPKELTSALHILGIFILHNVSMTFYMGVVTTSSNKSIRKRTC